MNPPDRASIFRVVATEAAEEPDAISRHPEIFDALDDLAADPGLRGFFETAAPGAVVDPEGFVRTVRDALEPYRTAPLDDAPEIVEALAFLSWVSDIGRDDAPALETPALALV